MNVRVAETELVHNSIAILGAYGVRAWRRNVGALRWRDKVGNERLTKFAVAGQSDVWGIQTVGPRVGRHWEVELKVPGQEPTALQLEWLRSCHAHGCVAFWCDNTRLLESLTVALIAGASIVWRYGCDFDIDLNPCP